MEYSRHSAVWAGLAWRAGEPGAVGASEAAGPWLGHPVRNTGRAGGGSQPADSAVTARPLGRSKADSRTAGKIKALGSAWVWMNGVHAWAETWL